MFDITNTLGTGAFGDVFKVKCLKSTSISESGTERIALNKKEALKIKNHLTSKGGGVLNSNLYRTLLED